MLHQIEKPDEEKAGHFAMKTLDKGFKGGSIGCAVVIGIIFIIIIILVLS